MDLPESNIFRSGHLDELFREQLAVARRRLNDLEVEEFSSRASEELVEELFGEIAFPVPTVDEERITVVPEEATFDIREIQTHTRRDSLPQRVRGFALHFNLPVNGFSESVLRRRPYEAYEPAPPGVASNGAITVSYFAASTNDNRITGLWKSHKPQIIETVQNIAEEVEVFNSSLKDDLRQLVAQRRERLGDLATLAQSFGVPIKRRSEAPETYKVPDTLVPMRISDGATPSIAPDIYEHMLKVCQLMSQVMERSPSAFVGKDEEMLRSHFLVQLNAQFEGLATGETFNGEGKTDILVHYKDGIVFVAECKFWDGEKKYLETIDQLLGYVTWRDTKTAIFIFNENKNFTNVLKTIQESTPKHPSYVNELNFEPENGFRYVMRNKNDPDREFIMTVLAFDIPLPAPVAKVGKTKPTTKASRPDVPKPL